MNAKLAKRLRKAARNATSTLPDCEYAGRGRNGDIQVTKFATTRGLYLDLKRQAKNLEDV